MVSELRDLKSVLVHIRELLGVLVRKERCAETKAEIAARRPDRMEREQHEADDAEHEANLQEALQNQSKTVKVLVDKWFVDKGYGFGGAPTGEIVFIHTSAVQGAEVLTIGTDAWAQVVNDDARAQGGNRARRAWGRDTLKAERDKEKANKVAQQVKRAAALTAELATQSEEKTAAVCDRPPELGELAGHIEAPNMGAGGSHPQATMMLDPRARSCRPSEGQTTVKAPPEIVTRVDSSRKPFAPRSATWAPSTRARNPNLMNREVQPRELTEQELRLRHKKEEAWELFQSQSTFMRETREEFEKKYSEKVLGGIYKNSKDEQEKGLQSWTNELQKKALERDGRLEARERVKMGEEGSNSRRRTEWERIFDRSRS